ncbi:MAG: hypothetical protein KAJ25_04315, partial [Desulfobacula sp.]|nr:hypothetical protein [Desulfobacula sp.]
MTDNNNQFLKLDVEEMDILAIFSLLPPPISLDILVGFKKFSPVAILNSLEILIKNEWVYCYEPAGIGHYALCLPEKACTIVDFMQKQKINLLSQEL